MSGFGTERDQQRRKKRLNALLRLDENRYCCECGQRQPQWASVNLGVFFCIRCSGIHRNLGVHISVVRSVTLDSWKEEWVNMLEQVGNARGLAYWEHTDPGSRKPTESVSDRQLEQFIRDKYVLGKWKGPENTAPHLDQQQTIASGAISTTSSVQSLSRANSTKPAPVPVVQQQNQLNAAQAASRQPSAVAPAAAPQTTTIAGSAAPRRGVRTTGGVISPQAVTPVPANNLTLNASHNVAHTSATAPTTPAYDPFGNLNSKTVDAANTAASQDDFAAFFDPMPSAQPSREASAVSSIAASTSQSNVSVAGSSVNHFDALFGLTTTPPTQQASAPAMNQNLAVSTASAPPTTTTAAAAGGNSSADPFALLTHPANVKTSKDSILDLYSNQHPQQQQQHHHHHHQQQYPQQQQQFQQQPQQPMYGFQPQPMYGQSPYGMTPQQQQQQMMWQQQQQFHQQQQYQQQPQPQQAASPFGQLSYQVPSQNAAQSTQNNSNVFTGLF